MTVTLELGFKGLVKGGKERQGRVLSRGSITHEGTKEVLGLWKG